MSILVAGTTCDYVDWIRRKRPGLSLFVTDRHTRLASNFPPPPPDEEILVDDESHEEIWHLLADHLEKCHQHIDGVVGYDCESLFLVSYLAQKLGLLYPPRDAVLNCRQKIRAVSMWRDAGLFSPASSVVHSANEATLFYRQTGTTVLKPLTGSGSEFTYLCRSEQETRDAFLESSVLIKKRADHPIFKLSEGGSTDILAGAYIPGTEYSCDFYVPVTTTTATAGAAIVTRLCRKYHLKEGPFGTTEAYEPLYEDEWPVNPADLRVYLAKAARTVGLSSLICMADIIVCDGKPCLLEMAPRPAGDCLLWFMSYAYNIDSVMLSYDVAAGDFCSLQNAAAVFSCSNGNSGDVSGIFQKKHFVALRLFADQNGTLAGYDASALLSDRRVCKDSLYLQYSAGHEVQMPPHDFDSRILGHVVYIPDNDIPISQQNEDLRAKLAVHILP